MTSPVDTNATTVRKRVTVEAPIERAFDVFTTRFNTWWPRTHHIGEVEMAKATLEPRVGGRWYERRVDGTECDWGVVLEFEPPKHVAVSWHLDSDFTRDDDPAHASRVDVWFTADSPSTTRVELTHSQLERHGENWRRLHDAVSSGGGWQLLLDTFASAAATA